MSAAPAFPPIPPRRPPVPARAPVFLLLESPGTHESTYRRRTTLTMSLLTHGVLVAAILVLPLLVEPALPEVGNAVRAFFVQPTDVAPPPPPPPPPAASAVRSVRAVAPKIPETPAAFVAPIEVPDLIKPEEGLDLGMEGGVPGGVEGGVPGGVVGGVVGGLPAELPPPKKAVRVGGNIIAPKLVKRVDPVYPALAAQSRVQAMIILEATVDTKGHVTHVTVLRGSPLFDEAAMTAVKQWRYQPLLLNGEPTEFILTVTVMFRLSTPTPNQPG
jgi:periplasmic protein TonB